MTIGQRTRGHVTILDIEGQMTIEFESLDRPVPATVRHLLGDGRKQFLLNLARVRHLDTRGLVEIMEAYLTTTRQGGTLKLEHLSPHVRELLRITRLSTVLEVFDSEAGALASFGAPTS